jgi:hypothetical protein
MDEKCTGIIIMGDFSNLKNLGDFHTKTSRHLYNITFFIPTEFFLRFGFKRRALQNSEKIAHL